MNTRPKLNSKISIEDFKDFYWYKEELIEFCRDKGLKTSGGKIEISQRIENYLKTGQKTSKSEKVKTKAQSNFDWQNEKLSLKTIITDNYKNTKNVRLFFENQIGKKFKFNVEFMHWMKTNRGKNLEDAVKQWILISNEMRANKKEKQIAPQFEYNTYIRDFLKDNPDKTFYDAIACWKVKKSKSGDNKYDKLDLKWLV